MMKNGEIKSGEWILFNRGKIIKRGENCVDLDPPKAPVYYLIIKVDSETEFPNLKSKRIYCYRQESIDQKLFSVKAKWKSPNEEPIVIESIVDTGAERCCFQEDKLPKSIKQINKTQNMVLQIEGTKEKSLVVVDIQKNEDWGKDQTPAVLIGNEDFMDNQKITFHGHLTNNNGSIDFHDLNTKKNGEESDESPIISNNSNSSDEENSSDDEYREELLNNESNINLKRKYEDSDENPKKK